MGMAPPSDSRPVRSFGRPALPAEPDKLTMLPPPPVTLLPPVQLPTVELPVMLTLNQEALRVFAAKLHGEIQAIVADAVRAGFEQVLEEREQSAAVQVPPGEEDPTGVSVPT